MTKLLPESSVAAMAKAHFHNFLGPIESMEVMIVTEKSDVFIPPATSRWATVVSTRRLTSPAYVEKTGF